MPNWLHELSIASVLAGFGCAAIILVDEFRRPQKMWIMNIVWPTTALFGSFLWLWAYFAYGRHAPRMQTSMQNADAQPNQKKPFAVSVGEAASHCGAGCTLGDVCAEWLAFGFPASATWFGWRWLFDEKTFAVWGLDFVFAFLFGIAFQYFTIAPMRGLGIWDGLWAAIKADTLSLTAWQVGMYGYMAFASFYLFRHVLGVKLEVNTPEFWFMMQIAMLFGFLTAYPVNWWLIRAGFKERM